MSTADPNLVIVTGENPFIRLSVADSDDYTTNASFWRIIFSLLDQDTSFISRANSA